MAAAAAAEHARRRGRTKVITNHTGRRKTDVSRVLRRPVSVSDVRLQADILHFVLVFAKQPPFGKCRFIYQIRKLKSA